MGVGFESWYEVTSEEEKAKHGTVKLFNERREGFYIGLFEPEKKARQTAERYLSAVPGFRDYPCTYEITKKTVIGTMDSSGKVHMIWGWDEDDEGDEAGIWSSDCYADCAQRDDSDRFMLTSQLRPGALFKSR